MCEELCVTMLYVKELCVTRSKRYARELCGTRPCVKE